jgi:predicted HNH restriction endonuclease
MAPLLRNSWECIMEEAKKCIMLCANCHMITHHGSETAE